MITLATAMLIFATVSLALDVASDSTFDKQD